MPVNFIQDMIHARKVAEEQSIWVVIVVPDSLYQQALLTMGAVVPAGHFSGRTAALDHGRLSLVCGSSAVFLTDPFHVMLLGWGDGSSSVAANLANWRRSAMGEIRRAL